MKTSKSPENTEVTPSKKKLKQARLPFKLLSEVSTSCATPQIRKRKLSAAEAESVTKIGKICKENDVGEDPVVISDDEVPTKVIIQEAKTLNPFVKLVDTAMKKKLQKSKKKRDRKRSTITNVSVDLAEENCSDPKEEVEHMDIDIPLENHENEICNGTIQSEVDSEKIIKESPKTPKPISRRQTPTHRSKSSPKTSPKNKSILHGIHKSKEEVVETVVLEDSDSTAHIAGGKSVDDSQKSADIEIESKEDKSTKENTVGNDKLKDNNLPLNQTTIEESSDQTKNAANEENTSKEIDKESILVTPKRSTRNKASSEKKSLNKSSSASSNPSTPKNKNLSATNSLDESLNESTTSNLTPKQLQKKLEASKKKEEREKEKQEREKKRQQEKEDKAKQRQEKEEQKKKEREEKEEAKRKEKEEKDELKKKEKEEKEKQKEMDKKLKEEKEEQKRKEKEEKEEQRKKEKEAKEEEKRKKQEALELEKQEQELKKKKAAEAFVNFFVPKQKSDKDQPMAGPVSKSSVLSSFTIKSDMRLAPTVRVDLTEDRKHKLDNLLEDQKAKQSGLYLSILKESPGKPLSCGKTWPLSDKNDDDDVMIVEDELLPLDGAGEILTCDPAIREKLRPKLLSFHDNKRPPYWGTWRKKSAAIKPRRPFGQDEKQLDYEVDSDEEWEEEQEGESIDGSAAGSDDEQDADEYEVDNEVFVPHGYLSDEEATMDDDDVLSLSPETQKARLKHLEDEFESEMKKPTEKLKPRLYGILWETNEGGKPENCVDALWNYFGKWAMIMNDPTPFLQPSTEPEEADKKKIKKKKVVNEDNKQSPKSDKKKTPKSEKKEIKVKIDSKKNAPEQKKSQPGINSFLTKMKST